MSTGVTNQRMKGQGNKANGSKDHVAEHEEVESWRSVQMQQGYSPQINSTPSTDPYMSSYYNTTFAGYPQYGVSEGNWSNGGDTMGYLSGYAQTGEMAPASYIEGIFGSNAANYTTANPNFSSFPAPAATGFNYFPGNNDYSTWGNASMARKAHYDDYMYAAQNSAIKGLEHGMQAMGIDHKDKDLKEPKKMSWATVASQPAKPPPLLLSSGMKKKGPGMPPPPMVPGKHLDIGTWETRNGGVSKPPPPVAAPPPPVWAAPPVMRHPPPPPHPLPTHQPPPMVVMPPQHVHQLQHPPPPQPQIHQPPPPVEPVPAKIPVLEELYDKNNYNPAEFDMSCKGARFFVIKSYSEDDIHRSIKYEIWCSTEHGNKRLDQAFRENENGPIYLFFSVNGSGHFCGMAQMVTAVDYHASSSVWAQDKWKGQFRVRWIYVKDVPNAQLRQIRLENNENKPVTNSRDTQEVPPERGRQVLRVMHSYRHTTSIFDDFFHYEKRQEEGDHKRVPDEREPSAHHNHHTKDRNEGRERDHRDRGDRGERGEREGREHSRPQRGGRGGGHRH